MKQIKHAYFICIECNKVYNDLNFVIAIRPDKRQTKLLSTGYCDDCYQTQIRKMREGVEKLNTKKLEGKI